MSKLNDLMLKLCPDGVEYEPIKKVFTRLRGTAITASKMKEIANPNGDIRIFAGGKTVINAFESDIPKANIISVSAVLVQSRGVIDFVFYEKPFTFKNEMWAYTHDNRTSVKFLYYVLKNNVKYFRDAASGMGSLPQISLAVTEDFKIPVPPLEVQREIVRILDNFTKLTVELTAELTARRKQYEYYRDLLLTFDASSYVEFKTLSSVADSFTGLTYKPTDKSDTGLLVLRSSNIKNSRLSFDDCVFVKMDKIPERTLVAENDILICVRNGSKELIGKSTLIPHTEKQMAFGAFMTVLRAKSDINYKFLFYIWQSPIVQNRFHSDNAMPINQITKKDFDLIKIPVPPLEEQERIVKILDRFDKLCNDLNEGLPAEIEARQKQYEYYRDKLLSFGNKQV